MILYKVSNRVNIHDVGIFSTTQKAYRALLRDFLAVAANEKESIEIKNLLAKKLLTKKNVNPEEWGYEIEKIILDASSY